MCKTTKRAEITVPDSELALLSPPPSVPVDENEPPSVPVDENEPSFVPVDETKPPLLTAMHREDDDEAPDLYNRIPWWYNKVEPWFEWANTEGPCTKFVTFDDPNPVFVNV